MRRRQPGDGAFAALLIGTLGFTATFFVVAVACDLPFVTAELLAELAARTGSVVVPEAGGQLHPLLARWEPALLPQLESALARGASLHETVAALGAQRIEEEELRQFGDPERLLFNVNEPDDLERAAALL